MALVNLTNFSYEDILHVTSCEPASIRFCQAIGLIAGSLRCPVCRCFMSIHFNRGASRRAATWRCGVNHPERVEVSVRNGTFFSKSRLPIRKLVRLIYLWAVDSQDTETLRRELAISPNTATDWKQFCRDVCVWKMRKVKIGGPGVNVEIDECMVVRRKYHRGHRVRHQWVFGGYEPRRKVGFLVPVRKRNARTLLPLIKRYIRRGSVIVSDEWKAYSGIRRMRGMLYQHRTVNHSQFFVNPANLATTNHVESMWQKGK